MHLTPEGKQKLERELAKRYGMRGQIREDLIEATEIGDLVFENGAYDAASLALWSNEQRILELERLLATAKSSLPKGKKIDIGSSVEVIKNNKQLVMIMLLPANSPELDPAAGKISEESPLGKKLKGKTAGTKFLVQTPTGATHYQVVRIVT